MLGPILLIITTLFYAISHSLVKWFGPDVHVVQLAFARFIIGPIVLIPWFFALKKDVKKKLKLIGFRTGFGIIGMLLYFWALTLGQPGKVSLIFQTSSIWTVFLAKYIFKDKLSKSSSLVLVITFLGLAMITGPQFGTISFKADILALLASFMNTGVYISLKSLSKHHEADAIMLANYALSSLILFVPSVISPTPIFTPTIILGLVIISLIGFLGNFMMTIGFKYTRSNIASILMTLTVPWMYLSGILFFNETFTLISGIGTLLVFTSVLYISYKK